MKPIEEALQPITGYLISITRNPLDGWYELEIGIPNTWVFDENNEIKCEILDKSDTGKLVKISPKNNKIVLDDLLTFVQIILETNKKIAEKEKQFTDKMEQMKGMLEQEALKFYEELDALKENSFKGLNDNFIKTIHPEKEKKPRKAKEKPDLSQFIPPGVPVQERDTTTKEATQQE
jgi:hypothetical protein